MRKIFTSIFVILLLVGTFGFVMAADDDSSSDTGFFAKLRLAFTFNQEKKIERSLDIAEAYYEEAEKVAVEDIKEAQRLMAQYEKFSGKAEKTLGKLDVKDSEDMEKVARVEMRLEQHQERVDNSYARMVQRLQDGNASAETIAQFEERHDNLVQANEKRREAVLTRAQEKNAEAFMKKFGDGNMSGNMTRDMTQKMNGSGDMDMDRERIHVETEEGKVPYGNSDDTTGRRREIDESDD